MAHSQKVGAGGQSNNRHAYCTSLSNNARGAPDFVAYQGHPLAPARSDLRRLDLLHLDGEDVRSRSVESRRAMLSGLVQSAPAPCLVFSEEAQADGPDAFAAIDAMGLEGIVSKKRGSRDKSGEVDTWLKTKTFTTSEFEVLGANLSPTGAPVAVLARRDEHGLYYVGNAFIRLTAAALPLKRRGTWLRPGLAARVKHLRGEGTVRHGTLKGIRHVG